MARPVPRHDRDAGGPADVLAAKAALREEVWSAMSAARVARFPGAAGRIPNFTGAEAAAERLRGLPAWQAAGTLKANPDSAQWPVRQRALEDDKVVYMAVPRLAEPEPFFALDPARLSEPPRKAASISGAARSAQRVTLAELDPVDLVVMGCVAAGEDGARLGKGGGFADLEFALAIGGRPDRAGDGVRDDGARAAGPPGRDHPADRPRRAGGFHRDPGAGDRLPPAARAAAGGRDPLGGPDGGEDRGHPAAGRAAPLRRRTGRVHEPHCAGQLSRECRSRAWPGRLAEDTMSFLDKVRGKSQVGRGRVRQRVGRATGSRRLQAQGLTDKIMGGARQLAGRLKDAGRDLRRSLQH